MAPGEDWCHRGQRPLPLPDSQKPTIPAGCNGRLLAVDTSHATPAVVSAEASRATNYRALRRFECQRPMQLWQVDVMGGLRLAGGGEVVITV